jgi:hypothetical protein
MITLSVDPHPGSHTVVALDPNGATLASITVPHTPDGLCQLHQFAVPFACRRWAIEGARLWAVNAKTAAQRLTFFSLCVIQTELSQRAMLHYLKLRCNSYALTNLFST